MVKVYTLYVYSNMQSWRNMQYIVIYTELNMHLNQLTQKKLLECISKKRHQISFAHMSAAAPPSSSSPSRLKHLPPLPPSVSLLTSLAPESLPTVLIPFALLHLPHLLYKMGRRDGEGVLR